MAVKDLVFTVLGIDKASNTFDRVGDSIDRMGVKAVKAMALSSGASAAAAAVTTAAVAAMPLAFAGLGAFALKENAQVQQSFRDLSSEVRSGLTADAAPLRDAYVGAADDLGASFQRLRPQMREAFADPATTAAIKETVGGVTDFAENAMPGMLDAVKASAPVMTGLRSLMADTGVGVSGFFTEVSKGSADAGTGLGHFGDLVEEILPAVGAGVTAATGLWAEHGDEVVQVVSQILDVVGQLGGGALPVMSSALGVALDMLSGVLGVLGPISGALGPLIGLWMSLSTAMKLIGGAREAIAGVAVRVAEFASASDGAATKGERMRGMFGSLLGAVGGPFGIALGAGALALAVIGQRQQEAAAAAKAHEDRVRSLTKAIQEDGGAIGQHSKANVDAALASKDAADNAKALGISYGTVRDAATGSDSAMSALNGTINAQIDAIVKASGGTDTMANSLKGSTLAWQAQGKSANDMVGIFQGGILASAQFTTEQENQLLALLNLKAATEGESQALDKATVTANNAAAGFAQVSTATRIAEQGASQYQQALATVADITKSVEERGEAMIAVLDKLAGRTPSYEEATQAINDGIRQLGEGFDTSGAGAGALNDKLLNANGTINTFTVNGSALQDKLVELQGGFANAGASVNELTAQSVPLGQAIMQVNDNLTTQQERFVASAIAMGFTREGALQMANAYGIGNHSLGVFMGTLSATDLQAQGVTKSVNAAGDAVYKLPNGKTITVKADTSSFFASLSKVTGHVGNAFVSLGAKVAGMNFKANGGMVGKFAHGGLPRFANAGLINGTGGPKEDLVPLLASNKEFISTAASTARNQAALEAGNKGAALGVLGAGGGSATVAQLQIGFVPGADDLFLRWLRSVIQFSGGNVQKVLGG
ncbi:hypothetical protein L3Q67_00950 [Saccharothrix sp. AJ9571]|nr:hypothetical protein L3Q67_00950 [Saccharothrix sp. AJ9571]